MTSPPPDSPRQPDTRQGAKPQPLAMLGTGFEFAAVVVVLAGIGWWLDGKWGTGPWLMLTGLAVGTIGGLYKVWRVGKRYFE